MGDVRALNLWLSLSRCGDEAPGLDIVPRRLDEVVVIGTDDAMLDVELTQREGRGGGRRRAGSCGRSSSRATRCSSTSCSCTRPRRIPSMPNPRFAVESWFFGGSAFPADYAPVAV